MKSPFLTTEGIAERWICSKRTAERKIAEGRIPKFRLGPGLIRYRMEDVEAYEKNCRTRTVMDGLIGVSTYGGTR
jgi:excisionase family DNA binding protein